MKESEVCEIVESLLDCGAPVHLTKRNGIVPENPDRKSSPLVAATILGSVRVLESLLARGGFDFNNDIFDDDALNLLGYGLGHTVEGSAHGARFAVNALSAVMRQGSYDESCLRTLLRSIEISIYLTPVSSISWNQFHR